MSTAAAENETFLAREYELEIKTGGTMAAPTFTVVRGWTSLSPSAEAERTDDTHAHSAGWAESKVAQRGLSFSVEFQWLRDADGNPDPGQQALREVADLVGRESNELFRLYNTSTGDGFQFLANVDLALPGGALNDNAKASGTLQVSGKPVPVTVDVTP